MANTKGKTIAIYLKNAEYKFSGTEVKQAVDTLLEEMWRILVENGLEKPIRKNFAKEMEVLTW
jgi:hypothetical protein